MADRETGRQAAGRLQNQIRTGTQSATREQLTRLDAGESFAHQQIQALYKGGGNQGEWAADAADAAAADPQQVAEGQWATDGGRLEGGSGPTP